MELKELNVSELRKLSAAVGREIAKRESLARASLMRRMRQMAVSEGLDPDELLKELGGTRAPASSLRGGAQKPQHKGKASGRSGAKKPLPPIYWNPVDAQQGWSGRGRKPGWFITYVENGGDIERLKQRP